MLGDRPVEVTLKRAWEALSVGERLDLGRSLIQLAFQRAGGGGGGGGGSGEGGSDAAEKVCCRGSGCGELSRLDLPSPSEIWSYCRGEPGAWSGLSSDGHLFLLTESETS